MNTADKVRLEAVGIPVGESARLVCPKCGGGRSGEASLSVTRYPEGLRFICFRASCGARGSTIELGELLPTDRPERRKLRPFTGSRHCLTVDDVEYFAERFGIDELTVTSYIGVTDRNEYLLDIIDPYERTRGYIVRQPTWGGQPQPPRSGSVDPSMPKALTYMHADGPCMGWYAGVGRPRTVALVEDQLSAMRAMQAGVTGVALLGTHVDAGKAREVAQFRPTEVIVALDADATAQAFQIARKWGLAWPRCRVALLERDLKDMEDDCEVRLALGV